MLPPNPNYGSGIFRRRLRLAVADGRVHVELEDSNHAFRLVVRHDEARITAVEPEPIRHPFTTCPDAGGYLQALVGRPLDGLPDPRRMFETRVSCTHLTDMTALAVAHVRDNGLVRLFDMAVEDERDGRMRARIDCDGAPVHDWTVAQHAVVSPAAHAGQPLMQGFHAWARVAWSGMPLEAAFALQRAYFVAQARRYNTAPERDYPASGDGLPEGVCYSYSTPAVQQARRIEGSKRDFSASADALLKFER